MKKRNRDNSFLSKLSEQELEFVNTFERFVDNAFPGRFTFVNQTSYVGIKTKGSALSPFLFKKPKNTLIFHYFDASKQTFFDLEVKNFDQKTVEYLCGIMGKHYSTASRKKVVINEAQTFLDSLSDEEIAFIQEVTRKLKKAFPGSFRNRDRKRNFEIRYGEDREYVFSFVKEGGTLLFLNKTESIAFDTIAINSFTDQSINEIVKIAVPIIENLHIKQHKPKLTVVNGEVSFLDSLNEKEKQFFKTYDKIIQDHYPGIFAYFDGVKYLSFRRKDETPALFWFARKSKVLVFQSHPKDGDVESTHLDILNKENLISIIRQTKTTADSYGIYSLGGKDEKKQDNKTESKKSEVVTKNGTLKIYSYIKDEILGLEYKALPSIKALCRNVKAYLLSAINESSGKNYENALIACDNELFFGNRLVWSEAAWLRSTKIIYRYFKANTLVEKIKDYEEINEVELVNDYPTLLNHLYANLSGFSEIDYRNNLYFKEPLPDRLLRSLNEIEENFRGYEIN